MGLTKDQKKVRLYYHYAIHPEQWVEDMFGESFRMTSQHRSYFIELGKLIQAKLKAAIRDGKVDDANLKAVLKDVSMSEEDESYAGKIGISVQSGQGIGKDAAAAVTNLFFLDVFPYPKVLNTAPTGNTLQDVLWAEISKWVRKSRKLDVDDPKSPTELEHKFEVQAEKVYYKHIKNKGKEWFSVARSISTNASADAQAETLAGRHEDFMLYVVDEATGVADPVFKPLEGSLTGIVNIAVLIFNPTRTRGFAIESHRGDSKRWVCLRWNAEESEMVSREHCKRMEEKYGRDSNPYRIRILGLPPLADSDSLIPYDWVEDAVGRQIEPLEEDYVVKGCDFGAGGDKSVIVTRKGGRVVSIKRSNIKDSNELTNWVLGDFHASEGDILYGDSIGIGWAIMGNLRKDIGHKARSVDSRGRADQEERFFNMRAQMYWNLREAFENRAISIPKDDELIDQLSVIKYKEDNRGRIQILKKSEIKKEIDGHSPDEADALALSYSKKHDVLRKVGEDEDEEYGRKRKRVAGSDVSNSWMYA